MPSIRKGMVLAVPKLARPEVDRYGPTQGDAVVRVSNNGAIKRAEREESLPVRIRGSNG